MTAELSNKILSYLNGFPSGLSFAQIHDGTNAESRPQREAVRQTASAVYELSCDGLICCNDLFAEASNGATREKQVLYKITHLGKMRLYGLIAKDSSTARVAMSNREPCDCGRSATKKCACGKEVCSAHWYDADGNHTIDPKGMCGDCVSAVQMQTWGESRCGIAGRQ